MEIARVKFGPVFLELILRKVRRCLQHSGNCWISDNLKKNEKVNLKIFSPTYRFRPIIDDTFSAVLRLSAVDAAKSRARVASGFTRFAWNIRDVFSKPFFLCGWKDVICEMKKMRKKSCARRKTNVESLVNERK